MDIQKIWVRPLGNPKDRKEMDRLGIKRMWTIFHDGIAVADVEDVDKWLNENLDTEDDRD